MTSSSDTVSRSFTASRGFLFWRSLLSPLGVAALHGLIATVLYAPAIFLARPFRMSTDNIRYLYPLFLFDTQTLRSFDFPSWNQYLQAGIDYSAAAYSIVYSPYIWLLSLWPSHRLLDGVTILTIAHQILAGLFSYLLCVRFVPKRRWALWASIVYVSSGMLIASQSIYPLFLTYSLLPLVCYPVTGLHTRKPYASISLVTLAMAAALLCNQPVTTPLVILTVTLVFVLYYGRDLFSRRPGIGLVTTFAAAVGLALLLTAIRFVPLFEAAQGSPRLWTGTAWFSTMWQGNYHLVAAVVPEVLGTRYQTPTDTAGNLVGTVYSDWSYCGIIPLFFFVVGAVYARAYRSLAAVALLTLAFALRIKPFADIGYLFLTPRFHYQMLKVSYPLFAVLLMAAGAWYCQDRFDIRQRRHLLFFAGFAATAIALIGVVCALVFDTVGVPRALCCLAVALFAAAWAADRYSANGERWYRGLYWSAVGLTGASLIAVLIWLSRLPKSAESISDGGTLVVSVLGYLLLSLVIFPGRGTWRREGMCLAIIGGILAAFLAVITQWPGGSSLEATGEIVKVLVLLGGIKMLAGFGIPGLLMALRAAGKMESTRFFCYVCLISVVDLVPFAINYAKYFEPGFIPYENSVRSRLDTEQARQRLQLLKTRADLRTYRVNAPNEMLGMTQRNFISHIPYSLGLRSYGGFNSLENPWLLRILERFEPKRMHNPLYGNGNGDDFDSPRLLDLLGVRYDVGPDGGLLERPSALSRFRVFSKYECLGDPHAELERLVSPLFDVQGTILLNHCPGFPSIAGSSREAVFEELSSGRIRVSAGGPGVLFFGDAFHEGWHPYINGRRLPLLRADVAFNAVELPAGSATVEWRFEPPAFRVGMLISFAGLLLLTPIAAFSMWSAFRSGSSGGSRLRRAWRAYSAWAFVAVFGSMTLAFIVSRVL